MLRSERGFPGRCPNLHEKQVEIDEGKAESPEGVKV